MVTGVNNACDKSKVFFSFGCDHSDINSNLLLSEEDELLRGFTTPLKITRFDASTFEFFDSTNSCTVGASPDITSIVIDVVDVRCFFPILLLLLLLSVTFRKII